MNKACSIKGCGKPLLARTYCSKHWTRWRNHGDPNAEPLRRNVPPNPRYDGDIAYIPLTHGYCAIVDAEDAPALSKWIWYANIHPESKLCIAARAGRTKEGRRFLVKMHRQVAKAKKGQMVDHVNRNPLDNRKSNLRFCNQFQNNCNRGPIGGTSKYKGVSWDKTLDKWTVRIGYKGSMPSIGWFDNEEDAAIAYNVAAQLFFGEFAYLSPV